jgi:protein-S-isoprenylcysteine O-methyltransferase Ste14
MFVLVRAITYAALFVGLLLIYLPARLLYWSGIARPVAIEMQQIAGMVIGAAGAAVALWCIFTFATAGRGTLAPFDPPRRRVIEGPYHFVRNPMCIGAGLALASAALFYESWQLLVMPASSFSQLTSLWCCTRSPSYEEPSGKSTERTAAGSGDGGCHH